MFWVYILHSGKLDTFYVGETVDLESRIEAHNNGVYRGSFTRRVNDWVLFLKIECVSRKQARCIEAHIKRMKSRGYILNLKKYPEIASKLKIKYN